MFTVYLLLPDIKFSNKTCVDLDAPTISDDNPQEALRKILPLRDGKHVGVQVFNSALWEFSEPVMFDENIDFGEDGEA
jgi:hypothetical protein